MGDDIPEIKPDNGGGGGDDIDMDDPNALAAALAAQANKLKKAKEPISRPPPPSAPGPDDDIDMDNPDALAAALAAQANRLKPASKIAEAKPPEPIITKDGKIQDTGDFLADLQNSLKNLKPRKRPPPPANMEPEMTDDQRF